MSWWPLYLWKLNSRFTRSFERFIIIGIPSPTWLRWKIKGRDYKGKLYCCRVVINAAYNDICNLLSTYDISFSKYLQSNHLIVSKWIFIQSIYFRILCKTVVSLMKYETNFATCTWFSLLNRGADVSGRISNQSCLQGRGLGSRWIHSRMRKAWSTMMCMQQEMPWTHQSCSNHPEQSMKDGGVRY